MEVDIIILVVKPVNMEMEVIIQALKALKQKDIGEVMEYILKIKIQVFMVLAVMEDLMLMVHTKDRVITKLAYCITKIFLQKTVAISTIKKLVISFEQLIINN